MPPLGILPFLFLVAWAVVESVPRFVSRIRSKSWIRFLQWFLRPWAFWAVVNLIFKMNHYEGANNPTTFPFFANIWREDLSIMAWLSRLATTPTVWIWGTVSIVSLAGTLVSGWLAGRSEDLALKHRVLQLVLLFVSVFGFTVGTNSMPDGALVNPEGGSGSLVQSWKAHSTVLYALPHVKSSRKFMRDFTEYQRKGHLRKTIHAMSHPPGGTISLRWLGKMVGAKNVDAAAVRDDRIRLRFALAMSAVAALNALLIVWFSREMHGSWSTAMNSGTLWGLMPGALAYGSFAQDTVYTAFFILAFALMWRTLHRESMPWVSAVGLGLVFYCLIMMNFSWCIMTSIFAVAGIWHGLRAKWTLRKYVERMVLPLGVMTIVAGAVIWSHQVKYFEAYQRASEYVGQWYQFKGAYQWGIALVGGQVDLFVMLGSVVCTAVIISLFTGNGEESPAQRRMLLSVLIIFALPVIIGPNPLKMETSRCWQWIMAVPLVYATPLLMKQFSGKIWMLIPLSSGLTWLVMRQFMNFSP